VPRAPAATWSAVLSSCDVEIAVALLVERPDIHAEIEEVPDTAGVRGPRKLGEQRAALRQEFRVPARARFPRSRTDSRFNRSSRSGGESSSLYRRVRNSNRDSPPFERSTRHRPLRAAITTDDLPSAAGRPAVGPLAFDRGRAGAAKLASAETPERRRARFRLGRSLRDREHRPVSGTSRSSAWMSGALYKEGDAYFDIAKDSTALHVAAWRDVAPDRAASSSDAGQQSTRRMPRDDGSRSGRSCMRGFVLGLQALARVRLRRCSTRERR